MGETLESSWGLGLERSCGDGATDRVRAHDPAGGVEAVEAWFAGRPFARHRHDTYAIGVTTQGVQTFTYRGAARTSLPGDVLVLHPDEPHDGAAGTEAGFGYRILYVDPGCIADAVGVLTGRGPALPFAAAVSRNRSLARAIADAFSDGREPLARDGIVLELAHGLLISAAGAGIAIARPRRVDRPALDRTRRFLDAERFRVVRSSELEAVSGLSRFELARQFRTRFGTSPYRYLLMRRLDAARRLLRDEVRMGLAEIALDIGFADQAHFTRAFVAAHGVTPARYRALSARPSD